MVLPLTVLHVLSAKGLDSHVEAALRQAVAIQRRGHRVLVQATEGAEAAARAEDLGLRVFTDMVLAAGYPRPNFWQDCRMMARRVDIEAVDVVHTHFAPEAWIAGVAGLLASRTPAILRNLDAPVAPSPKAFYHLMHRGMIDLVIAPNGALFRSLRALPDFDIEFACLIHNGVDLKRFAPSVNGLAARKAWGIAEDVPLAVLQGSVPIAQYEPVFFEAVKQLRAKVPQARAVWLAEERLPGARAAFEQRVRAAGLDETALRVVSRANDYEIALSAADVVVVPAGDSEAADRLTLEAMALGRPVVTAKTPGVVEVVQDGKTGRLVPSGDAGALAGALGDLLKDRAAAKRLGVAGREAAEREYGEDQTAARQEELYLRILEDHGYDPEFGDFTI